MATFPLATTTLGGDASWVVVPVVVLVLVIVAFNVRRAARDGSGALREAGRSAPNAVLSVIGTLLVVAGGSAAVLTVGLLPFMLIFEALGAHALGPLLLVMLASVLTLLLGAALLGRGLTELLRRRR